MTPRYASQLDVFGHSRPIIPARPGEQQELFGLSEIPDRTYGGSVTQPTLDGQQLAPVGTRHAVRYERSM